MKCDIIADGIVEAAKNVGLNVPLVVRLEGTNVELGVQKLQVKGTVNAVHISTAANIPQLALKRKE